MKYLMIALLVLLSTAAQAQDGKEDLKSFMDDYYQEMRSNYPEWLSRHGIKTRQGEWDDASVAFEEKIFQRNNQFLEEIRQRTQTHDGSEIATDNINLRLFYKMLQDKALDHKYRLYSYPVEQMHGVHSQIPSFLINVHDIENVKDAEAYIARIESLDTKISQLILQLEERKNNAVVAPKFVFPLVIDDCKKILQGHPFERSKNDCAILADFKSKIKKANIDKASQARLIKNAETALTTKMQPMYEGLVGYLGQLEKLSAGNRGVWALPDGEAFYKYRLKKITTTNLTPAEIFRTGESEVKRIHTEMRAIMKQVDFDGDLQEFFDFMRKDKQFYYANNTEGKAAYLKDAQGIIDGMKAKLDDLFNTKPKAELTVKAVEPFREKSTGKAFYNRPAPDGSRPGVYYANLYDMTQMPKYQMEALAYHEAIPGHHMQLAIAQELDGIPMFRKFGSYTAYIEGWGLYSEYIPKEFGFYKDPYSDFGRLAMELWRSCRLVADVGIHSKKWTREEAIKFYKDNTPNPEGDCIKMVERHFVMPGQATAYKIGMLKIVELKNKASKLMGNRFDIKKFHDVILKDGAVPLNILEENVNNYIKAG